jgi:hypothetical protein
VLFIDIFYKNVTGQFPFFPFRDISYETGEHPADFWPGNSQGPINSVWFLEKICPQICPNFLAKEA